MRSALTCILLLAAGCGGEEAKIEISGLEGIEHALAAQRGKGVLLNFWAMWCPPCVAELPELVEAVHAQDAGDVALLGISYDLMVEGAEAASIEEQVREFLTKRELAFDVLIYDAPDFDALNERFGLPGEIPVTLAFDRTGNLVDRHDGRADRARFDEMLAKALGH